MTSSGNATQLASLIAAKAEQDRQLIEQQTSEQLRLHADNLRQLSSDALSTTSAAIEQQQQALLKSLNELQKQIDAQRLALTKAARGQQQTLTKEITEQTRRLVWIMRWPVAGALAICLTLAGLTWGYWRMASPYTIELMGDGKTYQVMKGNGWAMCQVAPQPRPCRLNTN